MGDPSAPKAEALSADDAAELARRWPWSIQQWELALLLEYVHAHGASGLRHDSADDDTLDRLAVGHANHLEAIDTEGVHHAD